MTTMTVTFYLSPEVMLLGFAAIYFTFTAIFLICGPKDKQ